MIGWEALSDWKSSGSPLLRAGKKANQNTNIRFMNLRRSDDLIAQVRAAVSGCQRWKMECLSRV